MKDGYAKVLAALKAGQISKDEAKEIFQKLEDKNAPVVNEMHPGIDFTTRLVYKNFGADPEASFNYLQKKHPELNFKKDADGEILAKSPGEGEWRRLDPTGFDMQDITDIGYDVVAGVGEGAATVAGGLAAGAAALPTGPGAALAALAGGSAAGAAAGGGLEGLRQGAGSLFGIEDNFDSGQLKTATAFGAASPLLLGTGAAGKQIAKQAGKVVTKQGLANIAEKEAAEQALKASQRGLLGRAKDKAAPWIGEKISGIDSRYLKRASRDLGNMTENASDFDAVDALSSLRENVLTKHSDKMTAAGDRLGGLIDESQGAVSLGNVKGEFTDLIAKYEEKAARLGTQNAIDDAEFIKSAYKQYVPEQNALSGADAITLKRDLNDITRIKKNNAAGFDTQQYKLGSAEKDLARIAKKATVALDESITNSVDNGEAIKLVNKEYSNLIKDEGILQKYFKDEATTEKTLIKSLGGKDAKFINKQLAKTGVDVEDMAEGIRAKDIFGSPDSQILSMGKSATGRNMALQGAGVLAGSYAGNEVGGGTGSAIGAGLGMFGALLGSPKAMKAYMKANKVGGKAIQNIQNAPGIPYAPNIQGGFNIMENLQRNEN